MGLDIQFSRAAAIAAGMETNATGNGDPIMRVPGMNHWVYDDGTPDVVDVRANKWGGTYAPLTTWLEAHSIEWAEY